MRERRSCCCAAALLLLASAGCAWMGAPLADDGRSSAVRLRRGVTYAVRVDNATTCPARVTVVTRTGQVLQDLGPYPPRSRQVITLAPLRNGMASAIALDGRSQPCGGHGMSSVYLHVVRADSASLARQAATGQHGGPLYQDRAHAGFDDHGFSPPDRVPRRPG